MDEEVLLVLLALLVVVVFLAGYILGIVAFIQALIAKKRVRSLEQRLERRRLGPCRRERERDVDGLGRQIEHLVGIDADRCCGCRGGEPQRQRRHKYSLHECLL